MKPRRSLEREVPPLSDTRKRVGSGGRFTLPSAKHSDEASMP